MAAVAGWSFVVTAVMRACMVVVCTVSTIWCTLHDNELEMCVVSVCHVLQYRHGHLQRGRVSAPPPPTSGAAKEYVPCIAVLGSRARCM